MFGTETRSSVNRAPSPRLTGGSWFPSVLLASAVLVVTPAGATAQSLAQRVQQLEQQVSTLSAKVTSLEQVTARTVVSIDCNNGQRVRDAPIQTERNGFRLGHVTINITGVCIEQFTITRDDLTLVGAGPGAELRTPSGGGGIAINNSRRVDFNSLAITNGSVVVAGNSKVSFLNVAFRNSPRFGLFVTGGRVTVSDSFFDGAGESGVFAWVGSTVELYNTVIENSGGRGLELQIGATAQVDRGSVVRNNGTGIGLWYNSTLDLRDAFVENNLGDGVTLVGGSTLLLGGPAVIRGNQWSGIRLEDTSVAGSFAAGEITGNGFGVFCTGPPGVAQIASGGLGNVSGNTFADVVCPVNP